MPAHLHDQYSDTCKGVHEVSTKADAYPYAEFPQETRTFFTGNAVDYPAPFALGYGA
jgi:hypothetical protein